MSNLIKVIPLLVPAQQAKMSGTIGPLLGQYSLNIMQFCKNFNEKTTIYESGLPIKANLTILKNNDFDILLKNPTTNFLISNFTLNNTINITDVFKILIIKRDEIIKCYTISEFKSILSIIKERRINITYL